MENLEIMENLLSCIVENEINPADIISVGYEDGDYFLTLRNGESVSFSIERTR